MVVMEVYMVLTGKREHVAAALADVVRTALLWTIWILFKENQYSLRDLFFQLCNHHFVYNLTILFWN